MSETLFCPNCQAPYLREEGSSGLRLCNNCDGPVDCNPPPAGDPYYTAPAPQPIPTLCLVLPDSAAMRTLLDNLVLLAEEDEAPFLGDEADTLEQGGAEDPAKIADMRALRDAYLAFAQAANYLIHPEMFEEPVSNVDTGQGVATFVRGG